MTFLDGKGLKNINIGDSLLFLAFAIAGMVSFGLADVSIYGHAIADYSVWVLLATFLLGYGFNKARHFQEFQDWEKAISVGSVALIIGLEYVGFVKETFIGHAWGTVGFMVLLLGYAVVSWKSK